MDNVTDVGSTLLRVNQWETNGLDGVLNHVLCGPASRVFKDTINGPPTLIWDSHLLKKTISIPVPKKCKVACLCDLSNGSDIHHDEVLQVAGDGMH